MGVIYYILLHIFNYLPSGASKQLAYARCKSQSHWVALEDRNRACENERVGGNHPRTLANTGKTLQLERISSGPTFPLKVWTRRRLPRLLANKRCVDLAIDFCPAATTDGLRFCSRVYRQCSIHCTILVLNCMCLLKKKLRPGRVWNISVARQVILFVHQMWEYVGSYTPKIYPIGNPYSKVPTNCHFHSFTRITYIS